MADTSFFGRLTRLFSTQAIVRVDKKGMEKVEMQKEAMRRRKERRTRAKANRAVRYAECVERRRAQCLAEVQDVALKLGLTRVLVGSPMDAVAEVEVGQDVEIQRRRGRKMKLEAFLVRRAWF